MNIVSNCPLCDQHALHVVENDSREMMQCLFCGMVTSNAYKGDKKTNKEYNTLSSDMQEMSVEHNGNVWIPTVLSLPIGIIHAVLVDKTMFWAYAPAVDIPEDSRNHYVDQKGGFYEKRYDREQTTLYTHFWKAMNYLEESMRDAQTDKS